MTNIHEPFLTHVSQVEDVAKDTKRFRFRIASDVIPTFTPGQFFLLGVDEKTNRAYSVASSPSLLPEFDLLVKRVPNGKASTYLWGLSGGEEVRFRGPMGRFALRNPERKQIFVSTGTGIAPIRSMWQSLLEKENPPEIELIFGVRHEEHLFCMDEFTACVPHMNTSVCLSRPSGEGGNYFHGRVTDFARHMDSFHFEKAEVYLCGSKPMVDEMKDILAKKGVGADRIGVESW